MTDAPASDTPTRRLRPWLWILGTTLLVVIAAGAAIGLRIRAHLALVERFARHDGVLFIDSIPPILHVLPREWQEAFGKIRGVRFEHGAGATRLGRSRTVTFSFLVPLQLEDDEFIPLAAELERFPDLEWVRMSWAPNIGDRGFAALRRLRNLRRLEIGAAVVTDAAFVYVADDWPHLRELSLRHGTAIGDDSARELARLPNLEILYLDNTIVGDAGAAALATAPRLHTLSLTQTFVTDVGMDALATAIPALQLTDD